MLTSVTQAHTHTLLFLTNYCSPNLHRNTTIKSKPKILIASKVLYSIKRTLTMAEYLKVSSLQFLIFSRINPCAYFFLFC